jgi:uncharacterized repeat protein (TIGR03803 family)
MYRNSTASFNLFRILLLVCTPIPAMLTQPARAASYVLTTKFSLTGTDQGGGAIPTTLVSDGKGGFIFTSGGVTFNGVPYNAAAYDYNPVTGQVKELGFIPASTPLVPDGRGNYFGAYPFGGLTGNGEIFRLNLPQGNSSTVASFPANGASMPGGPLVSDGQGNFLGEAFGGASGRGTIFRFNPTTASVATLASFSTADGSVPTGGLVPDGHGNFLGVTYNGITAGMGTVFSFNPKTDTLTTLASFSGPNGLFPENSLVPDGHGDFLGTTGFGGRSNNGTIFRIDPITGVLTTLASFSGSNGFRPSTPLVPDGQGDFLGATISGRSTATNNGTIFQFDPSNNTLTTLFNFVGTYQSSPIPGNFGSGPIALIPDGQGDFYGVTETGGANNLGTIFELSPVPEPASLVQAGIGVIVLLSYHRWRRSRVNAAWVSRT